MRDYQCYQENHLRITRGWIIKYKNRSKREFKKDLRTKCKTNHYKIQNKTWKGILMTYGQGRTYQKGLKKTDRRKKLTKLKLVKIKTTL